MSRIKKDVDYGTGDLLQSHLTSTRRLFKDNASCYAFNYLELNKHFLSLFFLLFKCKSYKDKYILKWIRGNTNNIAAFLWWEGKSKKHTLPTIVLDTLEERIDYFREVVGDGKEFNTQIYPKYILLDIIRIIFRFTESSFVAWYRDLYGNTDVVLKTNQGIEITAQILNRLSLYIYWLIRFECLNDNIQEVFWDSDVDKFVLPEED